jgi:hypothetical protein
MDTSELAQLIVSSLAPLFPFLAEISKGFLSKIGEDIWDKTKPIWKLISPKLKNKKKYKKVISELSKHPDSSKAQEDLEQLLLLVLNEDRKFRRKTNREIRKMKRKPKQSISITNSHVDGNVSQRSLGQANQHIQIEESKVVGEIKQVLGLF